MLSKMLFGVFFFFYLTVVIDRMPVVLGGAKVRTQNISRGKKPVRGNLIMEVRKAQSLVLGTCPRRQLLF